MTFATLETFRRAGGTLELLVREQPPALLARPRGYVGPGLVRADLVRARAFGAERPEGWDYVVDTTAVRFAHPLNPLWLRSIRTLPHLRRYLVVAPNPLVRRLIAAARPLVRPDGVFASPAELAEATGIEIPG